MYETEGGETSMSVRLMSTVFGLEALGPKRLQPTEKLVLLALADWANDEGESLHPSMSSIARKACLSQCQARRIVHGFMAEGVLEVVGNGRGGAPGMTPDYRLRVDRLTASADATPRTDESRTPSADARASVDARASTDARDGSHGREERASAGESRTIIEPPENHQSSRDSSGNASHGREASCPVDRIVELYHETLPEHPRVQVISDKRRATVRARWFEWGRHGEYASTEEGLAWWHKFFRVVGKSAFLTGQVPPSQGHSRPFIADFDWLTGRDNMVGIFEMKYHREQAAA